MSLPNPEIWGAQNTWIDDQTFYTAGETGSAELKNIKPKMAVFSSNESYAYRKGCLGRGVSVANVFQWGTPIDETICPCGQDPLVSAYGKIDVYHNKKNLEQNKIPDYSNNFENENINWFFGSMVSYNQNLRYNKINIDSNVEQWAPDGVQIGTGDVYNNNQYVVPWTFYQIKSLLLRIKVIPMGDYASQYGETYGAMTLDDWKNNHADKKICGVFLELLGCSGVTNNTIDYVGPLQGGYDYGTSVGFSLMNAVNNGTTEIADYATFNYDKNNFIPLVSRYIRGNGFSSNEWTYIFGHHNLDNCELKFYYSAYADDGYGIYPEIGYSEHNYSQIMKMAACFGVPFTPTNKTSFNILFNDNDLYLPIIDENGITHGEYTHGQDNLTNPLYSKDSVREFDYDPTKPPRPTPSSDPITPFSPGLTLAGAGTGLWAMTRTDVKETINDIFGGEAEKLKDKLALFGNNPMNAIISLKWYPMAFSSTVNGPVILGTVKVNNSHTYPVINSTANSLYENSGTLDIMKAYEKNFYNSRNIQARLWLPFYGFYELPTSILLSKQIELTLHYNLPDELGVWIISFGNVIYDYCECAMGIDIPLTGSNAAAISEAKRQAALQIASQIATTAATVITGYAGIKAAAATAGAIQSIGLGAGIGIGEAMGGEVPGAESILYGMKGANRGLNISGGLSRLGAGFGSLAGGTGIFGTIHQTRLDIAGLRTNIPFHGAAGQTTFLNLPMYPYIQIFRNNIMSIYDEDEYKLKVGHACDVWETINDMPDNSLLQTTGVANMSSMSMELSEYQELNSILQTGFFK